MKGKVNSHNEVTVRIRAYGRLGRRRSMTAVVDTGYSGAITLPPRVIRALGFRHVGLSDAELGDGRTATFDVFAGRINWNGTRLVVEVDAANTDPLLGMELLKGFRLSVDVKPGGDVTISPLRR